MFKFPLQTTINITLLLPKLMTNGAEMCFVAYKIYRI